MCPGLVSFKKAIQKRRRRDPVQRTRACAGQRCGAMDPAGEPTQRPSKRAREAEAEVDPDWCCCICQEVLLEPVTLMCAHSFDLACMQRVVAAGGNAQRATTSCPVCRTAVSATLPAVRAGGRPKEAARKAKKSFDPLTVELCAKSWL